VADKWAGVGPEGRCSNSGNLGYLVLLDNCCFDLVSSKLSNLLASACGALSFFGVS